MQSMDEIRKSAEGIAESNGTSIAAAAAALIDAPAYAELAEAPMTADLRLDNRRKCKLRTNSRHKPDNHLKKVKANHKMQKASRKRNRS